MKVIAPTRITPESGRLITTSVAEDDYPTWSAGTAYTAGQRVMVVADHHCYEALAPSTGETPKDNATYWLDLGPTNRWRMFDDKVGTVTSGTGEVKVTLRPGVINAVALLNISGALSAQVRVIDDIEGVVYDKTASLYDSSNVYDWWSYFFEEIRIKASLLDLELPTEFYFDAIEKAAELFLDLSAYQSSAVEITLTGSAGQPVSIGSCVVGKMYNYGESVHSGASVGIQDYSRKGRDEFGNFEIVERAFAKRARWSLHLPTAAVGRLQDQLAALRATPAVYIGSGQYSSLVVYGFYRDFDIVLSHPTHSECSLELEGLI